MEPPEGSKNLQFFVVRLVVESGVKKPFLYLKYNCANQQTDELSVSEASLTAFCFPLGAEAVVPKEFMASEEYTFTLTGGDGKRYHGFCRKFLPPKPAVGPRAQLPQVICLVSEDPWATFYFKVLQVLEQMVKSGCGPSSEGSLLQSDKKHLPSESCAATFLQDLGKQLALNPRPSEVVRVPLPPTADIMGMSPHRLLGNSLTFTDEQLELQVPIDCGNGRWNCGVSLARLLWDVPASALATLMASMLLERRIILVSSQRDTVTAAVQAASALLYPFKWHHIYLPMLPQAFKDYLSAPMPFMVGLQSQMLHTLSAIPMDEITIVDLDIHSCQPAPGSPRDDGRLLPWREGLEAALTAAHKVIRSPTEHETSPLIASIMQEFFVRLFGNYRRFIHLDAPHVNARWASHVALQLQQHHHVSSGSAASSVHAAAALTSSAAAASLANPAVAAAGALQSPRVRRESMSGRVGGDVGLLAARGSTASGALGGGGGGAAAAGDHVIKAAGYVFEHTAFILSFKRNDKARAFMAQLRGSQLYAMFVQERLEAAASSNGMQALDEPFELRVDMYQERRRARFAKLRASKGGTGGVIIGKWANLMRKHQHSDCEEAAIMTAATAEFAMPVPRAGTPAGAHTPPVQHQGAMLGPGDGSSVETLGAGGASGSAAGGIGGAVGGGVERMGAAVMGAAAGMAGVAASAIRRIAAHASDGKVPAASALSQQAPDMHNIDPASFFPDDEDDYEDLVMESRAQQGDGGARVLCAMGAAALYTPAAALVDRTAYSFAGPDNGAPHMHDPGLNNNSSSGNNNNNNGGANGQPQQRGAGGAPHRLATMSAAVGSLLPSRFSGASRSQPDVTQLMHLPQQQGDAAAATTISSTSGGAGASGRNSSGVTVTVGLDGHKGYEGKLGSILRSAVMELTGALGRRATHTTTSGLPATSLASPLSSQQHHHHVHQPGGSSSSSSSSSTPYAQQQPGYRPQLTGDALPKSAAVAAGSNPRFMPQVSGGLLDVLANGRLKPPPSSARPLQLPHDGAGAVGPSSALLLQPPNVGAPQPADTALHHQLQQQFDGAAAGRAQQQGLPLPPMPQVAVACGMPPAALGQGAGPPGHDARGSLLLQQQPTPLLDGFDELASSHSPSLPHPQLQSGKSLLDL